MIYTIKKGDTLSRIAKKTGISIALIKARNPIIKDPDKIQAGWALKIPGYKEVRALKVEKFPKLPKEVRTIRKRTAARILRRALRERVRDLKEKTPVEWAKIPKVSVFQETIRGLPEAAVIVYKKLFTPVPQVFIKAHISSFKKIASFLKGVLLKGTPEPKKLQEAVDNVRGLQKMNLPPDVYFRQVRKIIENIPLR